MEVVVELDLIAQRAVVQVEMEGKNIQESGNSHFLNSTLVRKRPGLFREGGLECVLWGRGRR